MSIRILEGDVRARLADLPDESVHCVVTSPPYFGLRDYGTAVWEGGDPACDHLKSATKVSANSTLRSDGREHTGPYEGEKATIVGLPFGQSCGKCGATRTDKQIGLEPTPAEFVAVVVDVFREVRRVLRKDGTCWINLGDSYATGTRSPSGPSKTADVGGWTTRSGDAAGARRVIGQGYKPKDLMGIPWRVAFALQADGWYLRQDIIWSKPNPMPESVTDRCTKAHEYLFLLSKSARYHYDAEAIAEPHSEWSQRALTSDWTRRTGRGNPDRGDGGHEEGDAYASRVNSNGTRNRRSVWTVATQPFKEAHFATFPPDLIEPCIKAGCPKDCCAKCGAPVVRETERGSSHYEELGKALGRDFRRGDSQPGNSGQTRMANGTVPSLRRASSITTGWSPSCSCDAGLVRGTVLDPFGGAGTTGLVADRLQRNAILIELNPEYAQMARERLTGDAPLFAMVAAE